MFALCTSKDSKNLTQSVSKNLSKSSRFETKNLSKSSRFEALLADIGEMTCVLYTCAANFHTHAHTWVPKRVPKVLQNGVIFDSNFEMLFGSLFCSLGVEKELQNRLQKWVFSETSDPAKSLYCCSKSHSRSLQSGVKNRSFFWTPFSMHFLTLLAPKRAHFGVHFGIIFWYLFWDPFRRPQQSIL